MTLCGLVTLLACSPIGQPAASPTSAPVITAIPSPVATNRPTLTVSPGAPSPAATATARIEPQQTPLPPAADPKTLVTNLVKQDVAKRTGVSIESVVVTLVEEHEWPDSSLGCPKPGFAYAQVIIIGWLVQAQAAGKSFEYHTGNDSSLLVLCKAS